jgi:hypothetical protein
MCAEGFHLELPEWLTPALTFVIIGFFFWKSIRKANGRKTEAGI